jgi:hypothetical protein
MLNYYTICDKLWFASNITSHFNVSCVHVMSEYFCCGIRQWLMRGTICLERQMQAGVVIGQLRSISVMCPFLLSPYSYYMVWEAPHYKLLIRHVLFLCFSFSCPYYFHLVFSCAKTKPLYMILVAGETFQTSFNTPHFTIIWISELITCQVKSRHHIGPKLFYHACPYFGKFRG